MRKRSLALFAILILVSNLATYEAAQVIQVNFDQAQIYASAKGNSFSQHPSLSTNASAQGTSFVVIHQTVAEFFVEIYHHTDLFPRQNLVSQNFTYDCVSWCFGGIHYFKDPTTLITSQGRGIEQCLVFGATSTDTCTASNFAKVIGWSVNTNTPAAGDTYAGGATIPCSSTNLIVDANGLADAAGTVTTGANGATVTTTVAKTFSITGTYTAVQVSCVLSALHSGTNPLLYAESTFGPDSFVNGDSLTGTWSISRT